MNKLKVFENPEFGSIRTVEIDGEPWLVGKDVAIALGYKNTKDALATHVDNEDKRIIQRSEIATIENHLPKEEFPFDFVNGNIPNRGLTIINESGVYSLIFSSKLPSARKFKRWVTSEVLPAIRKTGTYTMPTSGPQDKASQTVEQRQLTTDDYIRAASIVSDCRNERLPYVLSLLEQGGFRINAVEVSPRRKTAICEKKMLVFVDLLDFL